MVRRTRKFKEEFENQVEKGFEKGIVVKLYSEKMSDISFEDEVHTVPFYRIWMEGEYKVLSKQEIKSLKKLWVKKEL